MILSIFSCTCWSSECPIWKNSYSYICSLLTDCLGFFAIKFFVLNPNPSSNICYATILTSHIQKVAFAFVVSDSLQTLWTVAHQTPLSMVLSRQEYCNGLLCCPPGESSQSREQTHVFYTAGRFFTSESQGKPKIGDIMEFKVMRLPSQPFPNHGFTGTSKYIILS